MVVHVQYKFTIPGRLEGLNEYTSANRTNPHKGGMMKRKNEDSIIEYQLRPEVKFGENIHPEEINLLKGILIKIRGGKNMTQSKNKLIEMLEYVIADHSAEEKRII